MIWKGAFKSERYHNGFLSANVADYELGSEKMLTSGWFQGVLRLLPSSPDARLSDVQPMQFQYLHYDKWDIWDGKRPYLGSATKAETSINAIVTLPYRGQPDRDRRKPPPGPTRPRVEATLTTVPAASGSPGCVLCNTGYVF